MPITASLKSVLLAERLLAEGKTLNRTAQITGLSTTTLKRVKEGSHPRQRQQPRKLIDDFSVNTNARVVRCPSCGGMVYEPCMLCRLRAYEERQRAAKDVQSSSGTSNAVPQGTPTGPCHR